MQHDRLQNKWIFNHAPTTTIPSNVHKATSFQVFHVMECRAHWNKAVLIWHLYRRSIITCTRRGGGTEYGYNQLTDIDLLLTSVCAIDTSCPLSCGFTVGQYVPLRPFLPPSPFPSCSTQPSSHNSAACVRTATLVLATAYIHREALAKFRITSFATTTLASSSDSMKLLVSIQYRCWCSDFVPKRDFR